MKPIIACTPGIDDPGGIFWSLEEPQFGLVCNDIRFLTISRHLKEHP